jgi:hypothetical protein
MALPKQAAKREEQNDLPGRRATLDGSCLAFPA